ncbi:MAG TPA: hypothetical protein VFK90_04065 [Anaeromyxobacter sp.]|nr:hypothetical protein [Anaeromyxobacter sp.]
MASSDLALPAGLLAPSLAPEREQQWTCRLVPKRGRRYTLHLSGSLHAAWAGRLAAGLAARHISVVRATARRGSTRWTAEIDLDVLDGAVEPSAIDFLSLLREHLPPEDAAAIPLASFRVQPTRTDVEVEIRGEDAVGLLGRILRVFGELGLYPRAMRVDTFGSAVRDVFLLQTLAGEPPSGATIAALRARLEKLLGDD